MNAALAGDLEDAYSINLQNFNEMGILIFKIPNWNI